MRVLALAIVAWTVLSVEPIRCSSDPAIAQSPPAITIMALGDSITAGIGANGVPQGHGGYRLPLVRFLQAAGYDFTMVGSRSDYSGDLTLAGHEGWPGYVLRSLPSDPAGQLYGDVTRRAIATYHPSVVLLMAGTNDLLRYAKGSRDYSLANIGRSLDMEIAQIFSLEPDARVIVAGVVDSPRVPHCAVVAFDTGSGSCGVVSDNVAALVQRYRLRGYRIEEASGMTGAVPRDSAYFPDGIHPSGDDGYALVAAVWFRAIGTTLAVWPVAKTVADHPLR